MEQTRCTLNMLFRRSYIMDNPYKSFNSQRGAVGLFITNDLQGQAPQYFITRFCVRFQNESNDTNTMRNSRHANRRPPHLQKYSLPLCCAQNQIYLLTPQLTPAQTLNDGKYPTTAYTTGQIPRWYWHERIIISLDLISDQSIPCL
jgi:hypothetical protein